MSSNAPMKSQQDGLLKLKRKKLWIWEKEEGSWKELEKRGMGMM